MLLSLKQLKAQHCHYLRKSLKIADKDFPIGTALTLLPIETYPIRPLNIPFSDESPEGGSSEEQRVSEGFSSC